MPAAEATTPSGLMRATETTTVPAGEVAAMPAGEAAIVPTAETTTVPVSEAAAVPVAEMATVPPAEAATMPSGGPGGARPAVETPRHSTKSGPGMAEMSDRRTRSDGCEAASHVTTIPPLGADGREGQDGRTEKERERGWAEDDERRRHRDDDFGWWQDHDWWRQRRAEERANRRRCDCRRGTSSGG
jgi:hypothetical protein